jgi:hypothetical protein
MTACLLPQRAAALPQQAALLLLLLLLFVSGCCSRLPGLHVGPDDPDGAVCQECQAEGGLTSQQGLLLRLLLLQQQQMVVGVYSQVLHAGLPV